MTQRETQTSKRLELVSQIGKSKVTKLNAKPSVVYPLIRLPTSYADEIGRTAEIFETQLHNKRALLITFHDTEVPPEAEVEQPSPKVIQLLQRVIQLDSMKSVEARISALETEISDLKSLLLLNEYNIFHEAKNDGLEAIRTPDLRRVKAMS